MKKHILMISTAIVISISNITNSHAAEASYENCKNGTVNCVSYGNGYYIKTPITDNSGNPVYGEDGTTPLQKMEYFAPTSTETNANGSLKYTASAPTGDIISDVKSLVLNGNITSIPERAYDYYNGWSDTYSVKNLTDIDASNTTTESIGRYAFSENRYLKNITLPDTLKTIEYDAFYSSGIQSIVIPDSVTTIGDYAFLYSSLNTNVAIPEGATVGNSAFNTSARIHIYCPSGANDCRRSDNYNGAFSRTYTTEDGVYVYGSHYYSSPESMAAADGAAEEGCETKEACQSKVFQNMKNKGLCETDENCLRLYEIVGDTDIVCRSGSKNTVSNCSTYALENGLLCAKGQVYWENTCYDEYPFAKKRFTPAEAAEWLHEGNDNFVIITFKK